MLRLQQVRMGWMMMDLYRDCHILALLEKVVVLIDDGEATDLKVQTRRLQKW